MYWINIFRLVFFLFIISANLYGQKSAFYYTPLNIADTNVQWIYVPRDTMARPNVGLSEYSNLDGPYHVIMQNDEMIVTYYSSYNTISGMHVEKINLSTGISNALFRWDKRFNVGIRELAEIVVSIRTEL